MAKKRRKKVSVRERERDKLISDLKWQFDLAFCQENAVLMKDCINKGCREDVSQQQESGRDREGEREGRRDREEEWTVWTLLARFPRPLQSLDLTSHVIRGSVNQQLGAQMKKCQLLPGAQQATEHSSTARISRLTVSQQNIRTRWVSAHSSTEQFLIGFGKRMALSYVAQLDMLL